MAKMQHFLLELQQTTIDLWDSQCLLELLVELRNVSTNRGLFVSHFLQALQSSHRLVDDSTSFRVSKEFGVDFEGMRKRRKERSGIDRVIDNLGPAINDSN